jgi:pimeloyl-ACP methyl ester carboxylesterase
MSPAGFDDHRRSVALPSADLSYVDIGDGPPALFVHGIATNAHVWADLIFELADVRRCIAIDLPLHGDSPARPEQAMTIGGFADVVAEFCEHIVPAPVDLVAHDTGGAISQVLAAGHPELLRTLTLTNCETQDNVPPAAMAATVELARTGQLASVAPAIIADPAASRALYTPGYQDPDFLSDERVRCFLEPLIGTPHSAQRFQELIAALGPAELLASEPALRDLDVPTLILWGSEDQFFALKWAYWLQGTIPGAREVIEVADAKLFFAHERAAELAPHIRRHWLECVDPGGSEEGGRERDLLDGLSDALDEYDAGGTDLPSLVRDTDSVIVELSGRSDPRRLGQLRRQWRRLAEILPEVGATRMQPLSELQLDRVSDAVDGLRATLAI